VSRKIRVLIVDDQALILDILSKGLAKDPGIEIVGTATNGLLALNQIDRIKPDVIILDMEMPTMNGIQFLHRLMPVNPIPTIVLSALTGSDSKITNDAFEAGAVDFLPKPSGGANSLQATFHQLWTKIKVAASQDVSHYKKVSTPAVSEVTLPSTALDRKAKTNNIILGMGAFDVTDDPTKVLKIFALGSCVGVALFCKDKPVVGLCHVVLPSSNSDKEKALKIPGYFADSGIQAMIEKMQSMGCQKSNIFAKIAGGAKTRAEIGDFFGIGQRNSVSAKATLLKQGIKLLAEAIGGEISRTVAAVPGQYKLTLHHPDQGTWEI
jgi:chemotaxis receptor (MCP) glutamine deamidase CheD/CheY-like chemotaxis protein